MKLLNVWARFSAQRAVRFLVASCELRLEVVEIRYSEGFAAKIPGPYVAIAETHRDVDFIDVVGLTFGGNQRLLDELSPSL